MDTATLFLTAAWAMGTATGDTGTAMTLNMDTVMDMDTVTITIMDMAIHTRNLTATVKPGVAFAYIVYGLWVFILLMSVIF